MRHPGSLNALFLLLLIVVPAGFLLRSVTETSEGEASASEPAVPPSPSARQPPAALNARAVL